MAAGRWISRAAVVLQAGRRDWQASAEGNGAVDALFRAVDLALAEVLGGRPLLIGYDVHALAEGPDAEGRVTVRVAPPATAEGTRSDGPYTGEIASTNIVAASVEAYVDALNVMLGDPSWAGATEAAGSRRGHGRGGANANLDQAGNDLAGSRRGDRARETILGLVPVPAGLNPLLGLRLVALRILRRRRRRPLVAPVLALRLASKEAHNGQLEDSSTADSTMPSCPRPRTAIENRRFFASMRLSDAGYSSPRATGQPLESRTTETPRLLENRIAVGSSSCHRPS